MPRALRISLWTLGVVVVLLGAAVLWIDSELKPDPLGRRVAAALADAKIKGSIGKVSAALDGTFEVLGVDLILTDGTKVKLASATGKADVWASAFGTYTIEKVTIRGFDLDLSTRAPAPTEPAGTPLVPAPTATPKLPGFKVGPYSANGRVTLVDGQEVRFSAAGEGIDSAGAVALRAGVVWPGFKIGTTITRPRAEIIFKGQLQRPLGQAGLDIKNLTDDVKSFELNVIAKDDSPLAAGAMGLELRGQHEPQKPLALSGQVLDATRRPALKFTGTADQGTLSLEAILDLDPTRFGILSSSLPDCQVAGLIKAQTAPLAGTWAVQTDVKATWTDLSKFSKTIPRNTTSSWTVKAQARNAAEGLDVEQLDVSGNGISLILAKPLHLANGKLPEDAALTLTARDANLVSLTPFLAMADLTATTGRWTGEAELALIKGEPTITTIKTHAFAGLTLERAGKVLLKEVDAQLPLRSEGGAIFIAPFSLSSAAGQIASGDAIVRPGKDGAWSVTANAQVGIAELAEQPGWEDLPKDKLAGIRVFAKTALGAEAGKAPALNSLEARITRGGENLLSLKLRQPFPFSGEKPAGVLVEASAVKLPLESLAALVPGLKLSGNLDRADLVVGFKSGGLFIRTEGAPVAFVDTSVSWRNKLWVSRCDLTAGLDLSFGDKASVLAFTQAKLANKGRILASGDLSWGMGEAPTTMRLQGNLGAMAEQPFAEVLNVITTGSYAAAATMAPTGEIKATLNLKELTFKDREGKVKAATLSGTYTPNAQGLEVSGRIRIEADGVSEGQLLFKQTKHGERTEWRVLAEFPNVAGDDLLAVLSKAEAEPTDKPVKPNTTKDASPLWHNQFGQAQVRIGKAYAKGIVAQNVSLQVDVVEEQVTLSKIQGKIAEGTLGGGGKLSFQTTTTGGPYALTSKLTLNQFDFGSVAAAFPSLREFVDGKADAWATAEGVSGNLDALVAKMNMHAGLTSKGGRIQAFGGKDSAMSLTAEKAGDAAEVVGGLAILAGVLTKNQQQGEKVAKIGAAISAMGKLQKSLANFQYDNAEFLAQRMPDGTIKITKAQVSNPDLMLSALGEIGARSQLTFSDWPLSLQADIRGKGDYAQYFALLGFADGIPVPDGSTKGPGVKFSGSLNNLQNDLVERLQSAVNNIRSGASYQGQNTVQPDRTTPPNNNATPKPRNPLDSLFGK